MLHSTHSLLLNDEMHPARDVGVAVIGLGAWGPHLLRVLGDNVDAEVRWICDLDSSRLARYRRHHPDARVTTRPERILADPSVDAVVLATPAHTHYELAMLALHAGKHVFVETPLAMSADLADDLAAAARERHCILMCGHTLLYSPPVRAVKRMIETGTLGDVLSISSSRVDLRLDHRDGSVIWDLGSHDFSILLYWLSEMPMSVRTLGRDSVGDGVADMAFVTMAFASGSVVNVELSWLAPSKLRRTTVVGSERMVVYEDGGAEPVRVFDRGGDIVSPSVEAYEPLGLQLGDFVRAIRAGDLMEYQSTLARSVVRIVEAADESLRLGGAEISPVGNEVASWLAPRRGLVAV
jgi:predicted dehydrogenase